MNHIYFKPIDLAIYSTLTDKVQAEESGKRYIIRNADNFVLDTPGIYTLEGPNQIGKTSLIRGIMGVMPPSMRSHDDGNLRVVIRGERVAIRDVAGANRSGLVAVFSDDQLIPTMTVIDQLVMRHSRSGLDLLSIALDSLRHAHFGPALHLLVAFIEDAVNSKWLSKYFHKNGSSSQRDIIEQKAKSILAPYVLISPEFETILTKFPHQLSQGAKAVARLLNAQMFDEIRVLFLDEALAGVQHGIWPLVIDRIKQWAEHNGIAVVAISHSRAEIIRWQPHKRFTIKNQEIRVVEPSGYDSLEAGLPLRVDTFPVYILTGEEGKYTAALKGFKPPFIVVCDKQLEDHDCLKQLVNELPGNGKKYVLPLSISEIEKNMSTYLTEVGRFSTLLPRPCGTIIIVGGGIILNFVGFIAATLHRGMIPSVIIPTTLMAMADVAVGSKTSLNIQSTEKQTALKHVLGVYANPSAVLLDERFIDSLDTTQRKLGLAECLKHGLLQDQTLYENVLRLLNSNLPDGKECFEMARKTMDLKSHVLSVDPWEENYGNILLYGHLHAHSLERAASLNISHGLAVFWGLAMDLKLAGNPEYNKIIKVLKDASLHTSIVSIIKAIKQDELQRAYNLDTKNYVINQNLFLIIKFSSIGEFVEFQDIPFIKVTWKQITEASKSVIEDLDSPPGQIN